METAALSKSDYLKRYMSKSELKKEDRKKKVKKTKRPKDSKIRIIDDDVDIKKLGADEEDNEDHILEEEKPQVAEIVDERPKHVRDLEAYRKDQRWKVLGDDDGQDSDGAHSVEYGVIKVSGRSRNKEISDRKKRGTRHDSDTSPDSSSATHRISSQQSNGAQRLRHDSDPDMSPPRARDLPKSAKSSHSQHPRRRRHDSDLDQSPVRKMAGGDSDSDQSPVRTNRNVSRSRLDASSNHDGRHGSASQSSPLSKSKRRKRMDSDSDQSPATGKTRGSDSDQSPARGKTRRGSDSDQSPPRRQNKTIQRSPPHRRKAGNDSDQSPPRRRQGGSVDSDHSPPRKRKGSGKERRSRWNSPGKDGRDGGAPQKATKTLGGTKAGLSSAREMREEARNMKEKEDQAFKKVEDSVLGRNAKTVVRDKRTGKRRNAEEEEEKEREEERRKAELDKKYKLWGKGLKQQEVQQARLEDHVVEASKPLARYQDDTDLDSMLRSEERLEDPMLAFMRKKKKKEQAKAGPVAKKKELPKYRGPTAPPPNRFNMQPGYRWDGVDRSNGFEKKVFAKIADKKAIKEIAYKWSTEDM